MIKAFRGRTERRGYCAIGSIKPNVGHLDRAAGVTGLIKAVQALRHKQLPPQIDYEQANPKVDLASSPFYVNTMAREWRREGTPRRAGVSSFGLVGRTHTWSSRRHRKRSHQALPGLGSCW